MKNLITILITLFFVSICSFALDVNTASIEELLDANIDLLDAMKILEYRKEHKINNLDELVENNILTHDSLRRIKKTIERKNRPSKKDFRIKTPQTGLNARSSGQSDQTQLSDSEMFRKIMSFMEDKEYEKAAKYIKLFSKTYPGSIYLDDIIYFAASILEENQSYDRAISTYRKIVEKFYRSDITVIALYRMAICYERMEDKNDAISMYNRITDEFASSPWSEKARKR
ncbi:MAG: hypothetical protein C0601_04395, partial [Candidatus Muiribacterium halophilum]